jgi:hypothetical protein
LTEINIKSFEREVADWKRRHGEACREAEFCRLKLQSARYHLLSARVRLFIAYLRELSQSQEQIDNGNSGGLTLAANVAEHFVFKEEAEEEKNAD